MNRKKSIKPSAGSLKGKTKLRNLWPGSSRRKENPNKQNKKSKRRNLKQYSRNTKNREYTMNNYMSTNLTT